MRTSLVDFHCHLDLYPNFPGVLMECERAGVHTLGVTTTPRAWPRNRDLAATCQYVRPALGLHPQLITERSEELALWESYLPQARYIGEVGLDGRAAYSGSIDLQEDVFEHMLKLCARAGHKMLTVHSPMAVARVLDKIEMHLPAGRGHVVLHWFTGGWHEAQRAAELGCYFSVNAEMLNSTRHRKLAATLPLDRILTETDGPFCRHDGRPAYPHDVSMVVELLAEARSMEPQAVASAVLSNLCHLEETS